MTRKLRPVWKIVAIIGGIWVLAHAVAMFQSCGRVAHTVNDLGWTIPSSQ